MLISKLGCPCRLEPKRIMNSALIKILRDHFILGSELVIKNMSQIYYKEVHRGK